MCETPHFGPSSFEAENSMEDKALFNFSRKLLPVLFILE
jgi:hypothetical protein